MLGKEEFPPTYPTYRSGKEEFPTGPPGKEEFPTGRSRQERTAQLTAPENAERLVDCYNIISEEKVEEYLAKEVRVEGERVLSKKEKLEEAMEHAIYKLREILADGIVRMQVISDNKKLWGTTSEEAKKEAKELEDKQAISKNLAAGIEIVFSRLAKKHGVEEIIDYQGEVVRFFEPPKKKIEEVEK